MAAPPLFLLSVYLCGPVGPLEFCDMISRLLGQIYRIGSCACSPKEKGHLDGYRRRGEVHETIGLKKTRGTVLSLRAKRCHSSSAALGRGLKPECPNRLQILRKNSKQQ